MLTKGTLPKLRNYSKKIFTAHSGENRMESFGPIMAVGMEKYLKGKLQLLFLLNFALIQYCQR